MSTLMVFIVGCGGSNSGKDPVFLNNGGVSILGLEGDVAVVGETVGLVLNAPESDIENILWSQVSGPELNFLGSNRKVISFDVYDDGSYTFQVNFEGSEGEQYSHEYSFTVSAGAPVYLNARVDHEANSLAKMSIRAYESFPTALRSVNWSQIAGPMVNIDVSDELVLFFTAPTVEVDTL